MLVEVLTTCTIKDRQCKVNEDFEPSSFNGHKIGWEGDSVSTSVFLDFCLFLWKRKGEIRSQIVEPRDQRTALRVIIIPNQENGDKCPVRF